MSDNPVDEAYKLVKKANNGILYSVFWHLSFLLARPFAALRIPPNFISWISLFAYALCAYLIVQQNFIGASFSLFFGVLMDAVDGKVARINNKKSLLGVWLDLNFDNLKPLFVYPPIALTLYRETGDEVLLVSAFLAVQFSLLFSLITQKWSSFSFAKQVKESYVSKSFWHKVFKQAYFVEGNEVLLFIVFSCIAKPELHLYLWTAYIGLSYLTAAVMLGVQIDKNERA